MLKLQGTCQTKCKCKCYQRKMIKDQSNGEIYQQKIPEHWHSQMKKEIEINIISTELYKIEKSLDGNWCNLPIKEISTIGK